jgi:tyrosyl-tRNA synthetase
MITGCFLIFAQKSIMNFVEELRWRGMIHDMIPGTEELLKQGMISGYIGFDPTSDSLGVGNMVQVMTLLHFQRAGHKPVALVGGATGMVGDPSGKSLERNLLSEDVLQHNLACQKKQLEKFLDFDCGANSAIIVNNYDWFRNFNFLDFIRDVGKHITINYMLSKDSVQNRLENGMSFTEFSYQLVQAYDFYHLYNNFSVRLQMGGSDQWGNIVSGTELIRRKGGGEAYALTTPLIRKADGTKFGKTEGGNVWLDAKKTSPYKFYQFWLNASDEDAANYIRIFTMFTKPEIEEIIATHQQAPHLRHIQKILAQEITTRVHSEKDYQAAVEASEILFGKSTAETLLQIDEELLLAVMDGVPRVNLPLSEIQNTYNIIDFLGERTQITASKSEARRMLKEGSISINKTKVDENFQIDSSLLIKGKYILVQKGKKNYYLVVAE